MDKNSYEALAAAELNQITQHDDSPYLDLREVVQHHKQNTKLFRYITVISDKKKFITQIQPDANSLPAVGFTVECGSASENFTNESMGQIIDLTLCCTVVLDASDDLTGAGSHYQFSNEIFRDLNHSIYNWTPSNSKRYTNGFKIINFQRIENLCNNPYEVYCVYYEIPCQFDFTDGYLPPGELITSMDVSIDHMKNGNEGDSIDFEMIKIF